MKPLIILLTTTIAITVISWLVTGSYGGLIILGLILAFSLCMNRWGDGNDWRGVIK